MSVTLTPLDIVPGPLVTSASVSWVAALRDLIFALRPALPCEKPAGLHSAEPFPWVCLVLLANGPFWIWVRSVLKGLTEVPLTKAVLHYSIHKTPVYA